MMCYSNDKDYLIASLIQDEWRAENGDYTYPLLGMNLVFFGIELHRSFLKEQPEIHISFFEKMNKVKG